MAQIFICKYKNSPFNFCDFYDIPFHTGIDLFMLKGFISRKVYNIL